MDEVVTCNCGNQDWVIGMSGVRCSRCCRWLKKGLVVVDVDEVNEWMKEPLPCSETEGANRNGSFRRAK